jgi:multidrug efflux pump subunit AcrA (membrane-fusion protein)
MAKRRIKKVNRKLSFNYQSIKVINIVDRIKALRQKINYHKIPALIQSKPYTSFFAVLLVLFVFMVLGNVFFSPKPEPQTNLTASKKVNTFKIGKASRMTFQGKVEKTGIIKLVAQMPGIVSSINVSEGQEVSAGTNIISLSTNYQGGNAVSLQRQMAQNQYQNAKDSYDQQGDIIGKQKDMANKNHDNQVLMQQIAQSSITQTQGLSDLNNGIINSLNQAIQALPAGSSDILALMAQLSQFSSAQNQTNSALQNLQIQTNQASIDSSKEQHDLTVEQLDLQRKMLDMNLDLSKIQYNLALVSEANMFPSTPIAGTVDRVFVKLGDSVNPGMPLANISGSSQHVKIVVNVPETVAKNISKFEPSTLQIGNSNVEMIKSYVSLDATDGNLYSVIFDLDDSLSSKLTDASFITVNIPIGSANAINENPFVPLDAVIQTQEEAFVYIVGKGNIATGKKVQLGDIQGDYVQVLSGLPKDVQIILNRNVIEGDKVEILK